MRSDYLQIVIYPNPIPQLKRVVRQCRKNRQNVLAYLRYKYTNYDTLVQQVRSDELPELLEDVNRQLLELLEREGMLR